MERDTRHRRYLLTINNPEDSWKHEKIRATLDRLNLSYWCMADEVGLKEKTMHTHIYFVSKTSAIRFSTIKNIFPTAHIEPSLGSNAENRAYVQKSGKWAEDPKSDTIIPGTFEEWGDLPTDRRGERTDLTILYELIKDGLSNYEILEQNPDYLLNLEKIERARQAVREQQYRDTFRQLETVYIWGPTGTGKTRGVMEKYSYSGVYRVTDYSHPFDSYAGEDVLLLDEYGSNFKIRDLLNYLDGYPLNLSCRYTNRVACYTKVYIISNLCLSKQYTDVQYESPATFEALMRRIQKVKVYSAPGQSVEYDTAEYMDNPFITIRRH
ncbi:hypothetical protein ACTQ34_13295 [Agathobaculum sp. LCP25S3_E8]|uniref:hypothetical protein n=1 Tax=Agathobaculum sp. LCP25S3_E8 TaxID=3438735 RepID=UPI003F92322C